MWVRLAPAEMSASGRLVDSIGCGLDGDAQRTSFSLRFVAGAAAAVDVVHELADDTLSSSGDTHSMTCCTASGRRQHILIRTGMVSRVTVNPFVRVAACVSITGSQCTGQQQGDTLASPRWGQKLENGKAAHGSPVARLKLAPAELRRVAAVSSRPARSRTCPTTPPTPM